MDNSVVTTGEIASKVAGIVGALRALRALYSPDAAEPGTELAIARAVLAALHGADGVIPALATVLQETGEFFTGFESDDGDAAADYLTDAADSVGDALRTLGLALDAAARME